MARTSIYKSPQGRSAILAVYDRSIAALGLPVEDRMIETRFGETHVLCLGPPDAPPLLHLHGGNSVNAESLELFVPLAQDYRILSPDLIGHPGKSADVRLSVRDLSYGEWAVDVLAGLDLEAVSLVGASFGAGIALRLAAIAPERITRAVLVNPTGLVNVSVRSLVGLLWPLLLNTLLPSRERTRRILQPMYGETPIGEAALDRTMVVLQHSRPERAMPRPATTSELEGFTAPTLVIAGDEDILFPARLVMPRARQVLPGLVDTMCVAGGHVPDAKVQAQIVARVRAFLAEPA